jgi:hypothetical protein
MQTSMTLAIAAGCVLGAGTSALAGPGPELYAVGGTGVPGQGQVMAIDLDTGAVTEVLSGGCANPTGGLAQDGSTLFVGSQGVIWRVDLVSGTVAGTVFATSATNATHNALAVVGDTLYSVRDGSFNAELIRLNKNLNVQPGELIPVVTDVKTMAVESGGLFVGGHSTIAQRGSLGGTGFQFFAACGGQVNSMAFSPTTLFLGGLHFGGSGAAVYTFDKHVGGLSYSSTFNAGSDAKAMAYVDGVLWVAGSDGVVRGLDPVSGEATGGAIDTGLELVGMIAAGPTVCAADFTTDGELDSGDLSLFVEMFLAQDVGADLTGDGVVDSGDLSVFVSLFVAGC